MKEPFCVYHMQIFGVNRKENRFHISVCILRADLEVNGQELAPGRDITQECSVGTPVNVKLTLTNNTS